MLFFVFIVFLFQSFSIEQKVLAEIERTVKEYYADDASFQTSVSIKWMPSVLSRVNPDDITGITYMGRGQPLGTGIFSVRIKAGDRNIAQNVQATVHVKQHLPVFSRRLMPGERLNSSEVSFVWVDLLPGMGPLISEPAALDSVVVTGIVMPGEPIKRSEIKLIPVVLPGATLTMSFEGNGMAMSLSCKAREEAAIGDRIRVWSDATRKTYLVTVLSRETAKWVSTL